MGFETYAELFSRVYKLLTDDWDEAVRVPRRFIHPRLRAGTAEACADAAVLRKKNRMLLFLPAGVRGVECPEAWKARRVGKQGNPRLGHVLSFNRN